MTTRNETASRARPRTAAGDGDSVAGGGARAARPRGRPARAGTRRAGRRCTGRRGVVREQRRRCCLDRGADLLAADDEGVTPFAQETDTDTVH